MSIAQEVFSRIGNTRMCESQYVAEVTKNLTSIWTEFIFKDINKARRIRKKGYDFTLLGQDIFDRAVDSNLPTGHYSYYLLITYKGRYINPLNHTEVLRNILYEELVSEYIYISDSPFIYNSIYRDNISADVYICTHEDNSLDHTIFINSILGDSLLYIYTSIPYLRFDVAKPIRFSEYNRDNSKVYTKGRSINIKFETHINGLMPDIMKYEFII